MAGGKSGLPYVAPAFERLTEVLPSAQVHTFAKLDHFGPDHRGPGKVAETVTSFPARLSQPDRDQWLFFISPGTMKAQVMIGDHAGDLGLRPGAV